MKGLKLLRKTGKGNDKTPWPVSSQDTLWNKTGLWRFLRPVFEEKIAPCDSVCLAGQRIRDFIEAVSDRRFFDGYLILRESNPFPEITGRICPHPCTDRCSRKMLDKSVNIPLIESQIVEMIGNKRERIKKQEFTKRVAIIGSGPAGLSCAYHLIRKGVKPIVFEKEPLPGGMLRYAIPAYRLPKSILDRSIERLISEGVEIRTGIFVGKDLSWEELNEFDAIFISAGAQKPKRINIDGEYEEGVFYAIDFLKMINTNTEFKIGERVAVIGGGNSAIDVARILKKMGSYEVHIVCVEPKDKMPAIREEISEAEREGILIKDNYAISSIKRVNGMLKIQMVKAVFIARKPDGNIEFRLDQEAKGEMEVNNVIIAIGETPDMAFLPSDLKIKMRKKTTHSSVYTNKKNYFVGGDFISGPSYAALAILWGKIGAEVIEATIKGRKLDKGKDKKPLVEIKNIRFEYFIPEFNNKKISEKILSIDLINESRRCLRCGKCVLCGNCYIFCPDNAIRFQNMKLEIDYDYCKGCGICVRECPRDAMNLIQEVQ